MSVRLQIWRATYEFDVGFFLAIFDVRFVNLLQTEALLWHVLVDEMINGVHSYYVSGPWAFNTLWFVRYITFYISLRFAPLQAAGWGPHFAP